MVLTPQIVKLKVIAPDIAKKRKPGQFVILRVYDRWERIPLTIVDSDPGQRPNAMVASTTPGLKTDKLGYIVVERETMSTTKEGVYAGGDIAGFGASVIRAMGDGRKAALAMQEYLTSR